MSFIYEDNELPEVVQDRSYTLGEKSFANGKTVTYYDAGSWNFSNLDVEDGDIEHARSSALAWIAWYNFLTSNPDVIIDTEQGEING